MERLLQTAIGVLISGSIGRAPLDLPPSGRRRPGAGRRPVRHRVEPGAEGVPDPEAGGLLDQDQEGRLERVERVVGVGQPGATDAQDHRPVAVHQRRERQFRRLAPVVREPLQQLAVGQVADHADVEQRADLPQDGPIPLDRHGSAPRSE